MLDQIDFQRRVFLDINNMIKDQIHLLQFFSGEAVRWLVLKWEGKITQHAPGAVWTYITYPSGKEPIKGIFRSQEKKEIGLDKSSVYHIQLLVTASFSQVATGQGFLLVPVLPYDKTLCAAVFS